MTCRVTLKPHSYGDLILVHIQLEDLTVVPNLVILTGAPCSAEYGRGVAKDVLA
jgi:hypothetical protein